MENQLHNSLDAAPPSPSRAPLSENPLILQVGDPKTERKYEPNTPGLRGKAKVLFADAGVFKRGENVWASTPGRTPASIKANNSKHSLHGTPPRTRKNAGSQLALASSTGEVSSSGVHRGSNGALLTSASKALASIFSGSAGFSSAKTQCQSLQFCQPMEHFMLEQDEDFWKDHNVQVLVRIRPLSSAEMAANGTTTCVRQESPHALTWLGQPESRFTFDHVACASMTQEALFHVAGLPMVDNCVKGYNSSIFAYGQTGSGKTYTMLGDIEAIQKFNPNCGITPRIFEYLFTKIEMEEAAREHEHLKFTCKCSFLEIYNEQIADLLEPTSSNLQIHEDPRKGLFVENLKEIEVKNVGDVMQLLLQGAANRRVAQTKMNQESSRSHSVFTCVIESQWVCDGMTSFRFGRLNLVDLAGSERQKASGAEGERLREAANINKSLSTLGLVIMILVDVAQGKQRHVPYRDSKLTFLLQESLGGNSKTAIIATVSPAISCANETLSTLKFAQRAKFIQNNAFINEDASGDVKALQTQIQDLKKELEKLKEQTQFLNSSSGTIEGIQTAEKELIEHAEYKISLNFQNLEGFPSHQQQTSEKKELVEATIAGCLRREQAALQEKDELAVENQQLTALSIEESKENDQTPISGRPLEERTLVTQEDCHTCNTISEIEDAATTKLINVLEEGNQALDEALLEIETMPKGISIGREEQPTKLTQQENTPLNSNDAFQCILQQVYNMAKDLEDQVRGLCDLGTAENKQKRSAQEPTTLPALLLDVACRKGRPVVQTPARNWSIKEKSNKASLQDCSLPLSSGERSEQECDSRNSFQSFDALTGEDSAGAPNDDCISSGSEQKSSRQTKKCSRIEHEIKKEQASLDAQATPTLLKLTGRSKNCPDFTPQINVVLTMMKDFFSFKNQTQTDDDFNCKLEEWRHAFQNNAYQTCMKALTHEQVLIQFQNKLAEVYFMLENESNKFNALQKIAAKQKSREKQWLSENMELKHQILRLQSDAKAKNKEIVALQNEEATLAAIVEKLHKGEECMTEELTQLKQQLEYFENQRTLGEQLSVQSLQDNTEDGNKSGLKHQKLITEVNDEDNAFMIIKREMEIALANLREAEINRNRIEEASKGVDSLQKELKNAQKPASLVQKQLMVIESDMTSTLAVLEGRLQEVEDAWRGERTMILMELHRAKLDAAEKIGEANEALKKFKDGQEIIKEVESIMNALITANEYARIQKLSLLNQWQDERECMVAEISELKNLITQKEDELQMQEQAVHQMIGKIECVIASVQKEIHAFIPDGEEKMVSNANSETLAKMLSLKKDLVKAISKLTSQLNTQKSDARVIAEIPGDCRYHFGKEEQKQLSSIEVEHTHPQYTQLKHEKSQLSAELTRKCEEVLKLKAELDDSKYIMLQAHKSHAVTKLVLQEKERELNGLKTWLEEATSQMLESDVELENIQRSQKFQTVLQKTASEMRLALQNYDETTGQLLEKLDCILARISDKPGSEGAWNRFLNSFELALFKLEEDANSCLNFSNVIFEKLDKTLVEKQLLEQELERNQELLKGSFFDLSLLQESIARSLNAKTETDEAFCFIRSLQEELKIKNEELKVREIEYTNLEREKLEYTKTILLLETRLSEAQQHSASMETQTIELMQNLEDASKTIASQEANHVEKAIKVEELELELRDMKVLVEEKVIHSLETVKQELSFAISEKEQLQSKLLAVTEQLDATRLAGDANKRRADEAQQIAESSKYHVQAKEKEVKILEKLIHELESTVNALESQMEILKREAEIQQLSKEDLEMELQALRHQISSMHSVNPETEKMLYPDQWSKENWYEDTKGEQYLNEQREITSLRQEHAEKAAEVKSLKLQVEELITAAEKQAAAHHQKLVSLEAMVDNLNLEKGELKQPITTTRKAVDRNVANCPTSPFKCMSSGLAQQINFEKNEELYSNKCRIDELEDLAASRQKEIFRLNKRLAEAETMTYDVIRDLLGVKSDITTYASYADHEELQKVSKMASHHMKAAIEKEKELEAILEHYKEERASWLEDSGRRQAEVVAARLAVERLRQKDFLLKVENKRLKSDLSRQKKRLVQLQDKVKVSLGQGNYSHGVSSRLEMQDNDLQEEFRRTETLLSHVNNELGRQTARRRRMRAEFER